MNCNKRDKLSKNFRVDRTCNPLLFGANEIRLAKEIEGHINRILLIVAKLPNAWKILGIYFTDILNDRQKARSLFAGCVSDEHLKPSLEVFEAKRLKLRILGNTVRRQSRQFGCQDERTLKSQQELGMYLTTFTWTPTLIEQLVKTVYSFPTEPDTDDITHTKCRLSDAFSEITGIKQGMFQSNLRLVFSIGKKYRYCGLPYVDMIQQGIFGLMEAVDRFDYQQLWYKFSTYAVWWIRHAILKFISKHHV